MGQYVTQRISLWNVNSIISKHFHSVILLKSSTDRRKSKGVIILSGLEAKAVDASVKFIGTINNGRPNPWRLQHCLDICKM